MKNLLFLFTCCVFLNCGAQQDTPTQNDYRKGLIFKDLFVATETAGVECYRIPSLVTAPNGDLVAAIDERVPSCADLRGSRDINLVQRRSTNNGKTWTAIEKIIDFPDGQSASDPSMIVD